MNTRRNHYALFVAVHQHYMDKKPQNVIDFLVEFSHVNLTTTILYVFLSMLMSMLYSKTQRPLLYVTHDDGDKSGKCVGRMISLWTLQIIELHGLYQEF